MRRSATLIVSIVHECDGGFEGPAVWCWARTFIGISVFREQALERPEGQNIQTEAATFVDRAPWEIS